MSNVTSKPLTFPAQTFDSVDDPLIEVLRHGARQMLIQAVEAEVAAWIQQHAHITDEHGHRQIVRNGHAEPRTILTGVGPMEIRMPRAHDQRQDGQRVRFSSKILPPYLRKTDLPPKI